MRDYLQVLLSPNKHCESTDMLRRQVKPLRVYTVYCWTETRAVLLMPL